MRNTRLPRAVLLALAIPGIAAWTVLPAARGSTAECMKSCNEVENACKEACLAQRDICREDCQDLPADLRSACVEGCNIVNDACYASCAVAKDGCQAACPRGDESPSDPLP